jgi:DNA-binding MarR family transcriptional regulator
MIDLIGFLNSPRRDEMLLKEAGVSLDRALFPLLVRLGAAGGLSVGDLADQVGRDYTTVSRQLAKLESLDLIVRHDGLDRRVRTANLTLAGETMAQALTDARRRLLTAALAKWPAPDRAALADMSRRFVDALVEASAPRS